MNLATLMFLSINSVFCLFLFIIIRKLVQIIERSQLFKRFDDVLLIYESCKKIAFDIVLQNDITKYRTSEAFKITDREMTEIRNKFIKITITELLGDSIRRDLISMRGDIECIINDLNAYFTLRTTDEDLKIIENDYEEGNLVDNVDII